MIGRKPRRIEARARRLEGRSPELAKLLLVSFHPVSDVGRLVRAALDVNQNGQIAADADRVKMVEEKEPVAAEKILDVVLGRDHHSVHAGLVEEGVKSSAIKSWRCGFGFRERQCGRAFRHDFLPRWSREIDVAASI